MSKRLGKELEMWENYKFYRAGEEVSRSGNYKTKTRKLEGVQNPRH